MKEKSSDVETQVLTQETKEIHQEETFTTPDGKWDAYITTISDGKDIKIDCDFVENSEHEFISDEDYFGERHE